LCTTGIPYNHLYLPFSVVFTAVSPKYSTVVKPTVPII
jgi:hypothetical protein